MHMEVSPQSLYFVFLCQKENAQLMFKFHITHCMLLMQWRNPPPPPPLTNIHNINFKFSGQTQPPSLIKIPSYCSCPRTTFQIAARSPNCSAGYRPLHSPYNIHFPVTYLLRKDQQTPFVIQSNILLSFL
jgi:hypothetical protein